MLIHIWDKITEKLDLIYYLCCIYSLHFCFYLAENKFKSRSFAEWSFRRLERFGEEA